MNNKINLEKSETNSGKIQKIINLFRDIIVSYSGEYGKYKQVDQAFITHSKVLIPFSSSGAITF